MNDQQQPGIDPSTPWADVAAFVTAIRTALDGHAAEQHGAGGYEWRWSHKGLWKLTAGAVLDTEPVLEGPRGYLRLARCDHWHGQLALVILGAIDGLPDGVSPPTIVGTGPGPGRIYGSASANAGPLPRPHYREPGGNTGVRPGPGWERTPTGPPAARFADPAPSPAGRGPGAAYVPRVVGPAPAPTEIAGSDLWPKDTPTPAPVSDAPADPPIIDDTGREAGAGPAPDTSGPQPEDGCTPPAPPSSLADAPPPKRGAGE